MSNAWVIAGTRIPTSAVFSFSSDGYSETEIIRQYPTLTPEDVRAAIQFERSREQGRVKAS
jgi:uncharacterized protein (DUF433 family)